MKCFFSSLLLSITMICCAQKNQLQTNLVQKDSFWKIDYTLFPIKDSTILYGDWRYIDTFSINNNKFRIIHDSFSTFVETYKNRQWVFNCAFESFRGNYHYDMTKDVNADGFIDLTHFDSWNTEVFLFNPKKKIFENTSFELPSDWALLDKDKKIFCDLWTHYWVEENHSKLYVFRKKQPFILYYLKFIADAPHSMHINKLILYKKRRFKKEVKVREIIVDSDEFDYVKFWYSNYKELIRKY